MTAPVTATGTTPTPAPAPSVDKTKKTGEETKISDAKKTQTAKEQIEEQLKKTALPEVNKQVTALAQQSLDSVKKEVVAIVKTISTLVKDITTYLGHKHPGLSAFLEKHPILTGLFKVAIAVAAVAIPIVASVAASVAINVYPLVAAVSFTIAMFALPHIRSALEKLDVKIKSKIETLKAEQAEQEKAAQEAAQKASVTKEVEAKDTSEATPPETKNTTNAKPEAGETAKPQNSESLEKKEPAPTASAEKNPINTAVSTDIVSGAKRILDTPKEKLSSEDVDNLISLHTSLPSGTPMPQEMQDAFAQVTSTLCNRIKDNPESTIDNTVQLSKIYCTLDNNSPEVTTIKQTVIDNLSAIACSSGSKFQKVHRDVLISDIAKQYADNLSKDDISKITTSLHETSGSGVKVSKEQLNCALLGINNKLTEDFGNVTPDDADKLQAILDGLPSEAVIRTTHDRMSARLQALRVLQNKESSEDDLIKALEGLRTQKIEDSSHLSQALQDKIDALVNESLL